MADTSTKHYPIRQRWSVRRFYTSDCVRYRTIPDTARLLGIPEATVIQWLDGHKLAACKIGAHPEPHIDLEDILTRSLLDEEDAQPPEAVN